jgi:hypothetical protein
MNLSVLNAYAFLLKTRFGKNLDVKITVPEEKVAEKNRAAFFTNFNGKRH